MTEVRGRPLFACAALLIVWTAARIGLMDSGGLIRSGQAQQIAKTAEAFAAADIRYNTKDPPQRRIEPSTDRRSNLYSQAVFAAHGKLEPILGISNRLPVSSNPRQMANPQEIIIASRAALLDTQSENRPPASQRQLLSSPFAAPSENRLTVYAYSFWRPGSPSILDAAAPQYGGSQSGLIATYRLTKKEQADVSLLMRAAITPGRFADKELALGLRTRPIASLPITLSAERRFRANSRDQYAVYAAGSADNIGLLPGVKARGFAQAGVIPGKSPNLFFDAGLRAEHRIHSLGNADISLGAGTWAGGQRGASRFDVGPTLHANIKLGDTKLDVSADWRFRVGGNAQPKHGPAITISTGF
jgi:hypothetical protein